MTTEDGNHSNSPQINIPLELGKRNEKIAKRTDAIYHEFERLKEKNKKCSCGQTEEVKRLRNSIETVLVAVPTGEQDEEMLLDSLKEYLRGVLEGKW
ncbi:hypothetical protein JCM9157_3892 [Halalkalibacter akibai JCM 9157]|uniref:Uncharacterized protein n=2 Tax=Halalkalibacter akibai TaxID=1411 RepID=W4QXP7_HALA3|nr:hypothetical protein JCM9157_3892 [Halalkalibacter akibai JCM 9157]